jgi:predicted N-acetyltransferase YhbS
MHYRAFKPRDAAAIEALFISVFSQSEGVDEGALIGNLVKDMIASTDSRDLYGFVAVEGKQILGAIFFSRLTLEKDVDVFILAPVAVHSDHQGLGIGQTLITHGLQDLQERGVRYVTTYGDPSFYSKVGFHPISQDLIQPPLELSQPEGWLGQPLTDDAIVTLPGRSICVKALDDPAYW